MLMIRRLTVKGERSFVVARAQEGRQDKEKQWEWALQSADTTHDEKQMEDACLFRYRLTLLPSILEFFTPHRLTLPIILDSLPIPKFNVTLFSIP